MIRHNDRDFLLALGVEPYEPERFVDEVRLRRRDRLIQVMGVIQALAFVGALIWTWM